jgi:hypothetical protein
VRPSSSRLIVVALVLATLNFLYFVPRDVELAPSALGYDVRAFYCAGAVANAGADPYLAGPLRACQHAVSRQYDSTSNVVIPAPAPGYTIALFRALAQLPFGAASWLWALVLLAATAVTVYALRGLSGFSWSVVIAAVAIGDCWVSLVTGQMVPVIVAGIALCALLLERKQPAWAAVAAAATMLEPHVGLAVCLGIFVLVPRTRVALLGCAAALAFLSVAATGVAGNVEYFARALPAQVAAEVAAQEQYSVTYLLHRLGMPDGAAIAVGQAWYAVAVVAGIAAARRLVAGGLGVSLVALLPAAAAVIGGPYVHLHQIAAAMPAALVLAARVPERRVLFAWSVVLLAIPWGRFLDLRSPLVFVGIAWAVLVAGLVGWSWRAAIWSALGCMLFIYGALIGIGQREFKDEWLAGYGDPTLLASTVWAAFVRAVHYPLRTDITFAVVKLPTIAGLALLVYGVVLVVRATASPRAKPTASA